MSKHTWLYLEQHSAQLQYPDGEIEILSIDDLIERYMESPDAKTLGNVRRGHEP